MRSGARSKTRDRILDGAVQAVARHGLSKVGMSDVSEHAGVSRGTVYRYFPSRGELLSQLADREAERFRGRLAQEIDGAPSEGDRLRIAIHYATQLAQEHPILQRLLETDSALVLRAIRERYDVIRADIGRMLAPILKETAPVRVGVASTDQLVDWMTRILISAYLLPDAQPDRMEQGLISMVEMLIDVSESLGTAKFGHGASSELADSEHGR